MEVMSKIVISNIYLKKKKCFFDWIPSSWGNLQIIPYLQREDLPDLNIRSVWAFKIFGGEKKLANISISNAYICKTPCKKYIQCTYNYKDKDNYENAPKSQVYILYDKN